MQRNQRRLRPRVRPVQEKAPAESARKRSYASALCVETAVVALARRFRAAEDFMVAHVAPLEPRAAAEGKVLFGGIDDLYEMAAEAPARHSGERPFDCLHRCEEI